MIKNKISVTDYKKLIIKTKRVPLSDLFKAHWDLLCPNLPQPIQEHTFCERRWRFDFAWPDLKIAVECDGMVWQAGGGRHNSDEDRDKLNIAAMLGWRILRFSGKQLRSSPELCFAIVKNILTNNTNDADNLALELKTKRKHKINKKVKKPLFRVLKTC